MTREEKLIKNTAILSIGTFLPRLASYITLPILTGVLSKEEYGAFDLITVLASLLLPAVTLQLQTAAFRFLIDAKNDPEKASGIITNIYAFIIPISLLMLTPVCLCLPMEDIITRILVCLFLYADILLSTTGQVARGLGRMADYSFSSVLSAVSKLILTLVFVKMIPLGFRGAVISLVGSSFISLVLLIYRLRLYNHMRPSCVNRKQLSQMLSYSWPMVPNSMSMWVMRLSDRLVVTVFMGISANAVYAVANKIPSLLNLAQSAFTMAWQENASIVSKDEDAGIYYSQMFQMLFNLMAGFLGLLICVTPLVFRLLIRGDYAEAYYQMPILFVATFFYAMATFLGGIYVAYMKTKSVGVTTAAAALCNVVIDLSCIKWIGLYAASGSTLISYLFLLLYRMFDVRRFIQIDYSYFRMAAVTTVLVLESVLCFLRNPVLDIVNILIGCLAFLTFNQVFIRTVLSRIGASIIPRRQ